MTEPIAASPRFKARMAGVFEGLEGLAATFVQVIVFGRIFVSANAAATAANILGNESLYRLEFASWPTRRRNLGERHQEKGGN